LYKYETLATGGLFIQSSRGNRPDDAAATWPARAKVLIPARETGEIKEFAKRFL
jgi:hypothetical protein